MHMSLCKDIGLATDKALKKHKLNTARQSQVKKADVAAHRESAVQAAEKQAVWAAEKQAALSSQVLPDNWDMDTDADMNEVLPVQNSPSPPPRPSGRPNQQTWLPCCYCDELPPNLPIISVSKDLDENDEPIEPAGHAPCKSIPIPTSALFCTETNSFGVYHRYALGLPTITPDESFTLSSVSDSISITHDPADSHSNVLGNRLFEFITSLFNPNELSGMYYIYPI